MAEEASRFDAFLLYLVVLGAIGLVYVLNELLPGPFGSDRAYERGRAYYKEGKYEEAQGQFDRAIRLNPTRHEAYFARAIIHRRLGSLDDAIKDYSSVIRLKPDHSAAFYNRGLIYSDLGNPEAAIADFEGATRAKPSDPDPYLRRAEVYRELGAFDRGIAEYDALIQLNPKHLEYYFGRGALRRDTADLDGAIADSEAAIGIAPKTAAPYLERGRLRREKGDIAGAIADFDKAISLKPEDLRPYLERGRAYRDTGRIAVAKIEFDEVVKTRPNLATGYWDRGLMELFLLGQATAAAEDLNTAVVKGFEYKTTRELVNFGVQYLGGTVTAEGPMLAPDVPFYPAIQYVVLWRHIARARSGQDDKEELKSSISRLMGFFWETISYATLPVRTAQPRRVSWPAHILALYAGAIPPNVVHQAAKAAPGIHQRRLRLCEANLHIGEYHLEKGAKEEARRSLQAAADGCPASVPEAVFAKAELARVGR